MQHKGTSRNKANSQPTPPNRHHVWHSPAGTIQEICAPYYKFSYTLRLWKKAKKKIKNIYILRYKIAWCDDDIKVNLTICQLLNF